MSPSACQLMAWSIVLELVENPHTKQCNNVCSYVFVSADVVFLKAYPQVIS